MYLIYNSTYLLLFIIVLTSIRDGAYISLLEYLPLSIAVLTLICKYVDDARDQRLGTLRTVLNEE